jgi:hypothetical protein
MASFRKRLDQAPSSEELPHADDDAMTRWPVAERWQTVIAIGEA